MTIRHHKRQARLRAAAKGTTHQAELNAIARENGHSAWGEFQSVLAASARTAAMDDAVRRLMESEHLDTLVEAYEVARDKGLHLVVLRPTDGEETKAIDMMRAAVREEAFARRLFGVVFAQALSTDVIEEAEARGLTIVSGSYGMSKAATRGQFLVADQRHALREGEALVSRRDQEIIYATTAVKYVLPAGGAETVEELRGAVGATTIRRQSYSRRTIGAASAPEGTIFRTVDDGMRLELDWNTPLDQRDADWRRIPFLPAFNVLGPRFLPERGPGRDAHVERIASILIPRRDDRHDYFEERARETLAGFLHVEIERAGRAERAASIPSLVDWLNGGLRAASERNDAARRRAYETGSYHQGDAFSDWMRELAGECETNGYDPICAARIAPFVDMAPNERSGVFGTMDKALLPFKNREVRERNS